MPILNKDISRVYAHPNILRIPYPDGINVWLDMSCSSEVEHMGVWQRLYTLPSKGESPHT